MDTFIIFWTSSVWICLTMLQVLCGVHSWIISCFCLRDLISRCFQTPLKCLKTCSISNTIPSYIPESHFSNSSKELTVTHRNSAVDAFDQAWEILDDCVFFQEIYMVAFPRACERPCLHNPIHLTSTSTATSTVNNVSWAVYGVASCPYVPGLPGCRGFVGCRR